MEVEGRNTEKVGVREKERDSDVAGVNRYPR